jgi:sugar/nucleoside kinase (ribokinase family)
MLIAGAGCCLIDSIYMNCSYTDKAFQQLWTKKRGDGGLIEGGLVFSEDLEKLTSKEYNEILKDISKGRAPDIKNLGGPAVVAMVHAAQLLYSKDVDLVFHGVVGKDENAKHIRRILDTIPMHTSLKEIPSEKTETTEVFDDPSQFNGKGERSFINTIGAANSFGPEDLPDSFYHADILLLGGTALVPKLHEKLHEVLIKAKEKKCITVVGTVYDFKNEKEHPELAWPLGDRSSYKHIDILITDEEEAKRLTNTEEIVDAANAFISYGVGAIIITRGAREMLVWSGGSIIQSTDISYYPVSAYIDNAIEADPTLRKDTTGCGDNFMGGVIVGLALQMLDGKKKEIDLAYLCAWAAASGGFTCTYHGGTFLETSKDEKRTLLEPIVRDYLINL